MPVYASANTGLHRTPTPQTSIFTTSPWKKCNSLVQSGDQLTCKSILVVRTVVPQQGSTLTGRQSEFCGFWHFAFERVHTSVTAWPHRDGPTYIPMLYLPMQYSISE